MERLIIGKEIIELKNRLKIKKGEKIGMNGKKTDLLAYSKTDMNKKLIDLINPPLV